MLGLKYAEIQATKSMTTALEKPYNSNYDHQKRIAICNE